MNKTFLKYLKPAIPGLLVLFILIGIYYRFNWVNWSQGTNLHPDEYGLTNTLTALRVPDSLGDYFNTRLSTFSAYSKYDLAGNKTANGPDNGMRWGQWPQIILRTLAELTGNTGYNELRLMGRTVSALVDTLTLLFIFLIGARLYNRTVGLGAAALSALAVLQIQSSHFMTVDNYATLFGTITMYAAVRVAQQALARRRTTKVVTTKETSEGTTEVVTTNAHGAMTEVVSPYVPDRWALVWFAVGGVAFGMGLASKINLLPLGGLLLVAAFISAADLKVKTRQDPRNVLLSAFVGLVVFGLATAITFRVTQPMSFRAATGDTTLLTLRPNPDWLLNMQAAARESAGEGGGPPAEQWAHRPIFIFPLSNMLLWGLGLPLGLMAWAGFLWAGWRVVRYREGWRAHLLPLVWSGGYFLYMATRWVKSIRYFLPIYPFLALFAAWGVYELWRRVLQPRMIITGGEGIETLRALRTPRNTAKNFKVVLAGAMTLLVYFGTLVWANAFVSAVYRQDHTRIQATKWMFENIPSPVHLALVGENGAYTEPVGLPDQTLLQEGLAYTVYFQARQTGRLSQVTLPHLYAEGDAGTVTVTIAADREGQTALDQARLAVQSSAAGRPGPAATGEFQGATLEKDQTYFVLLQAQGTSAMVYRSVIANESWDEGLPFPFDNRDPFGQLYRGLTMQSRWYDTQEKRDMLLETLQQVDYVVLPSQRAIWSSCRLPRTYPMTMEYYRALFDGRLGFELVASFSAPLKLGLLQISDVGGTWAWNRTPSLPLFNNNLTAAEEAFSVYDHPPVWIFHKRTDFSLENVQKILEAIDLSQVVVESPFNASGTPCK